MQVTGVIVTHHALKRFRRRFDRNASPESVADMALAAEVLTARRLMKAGFHPQAGREFRRYGGVIFVLKATRPSPVVLTVMRAKG